MPLREYDAQPPSPTSRVYLQQGDTDENVPQSIVDEVVVVPPSTVAEENAAMVSFKRPPSLAPLIPICVYIVLSAAGPSMVYPLLPKVRSNYFGSDTQAVLWASICDSVNASIGFFTGGLIGLASDVYGRKIVLLVCSFEAVIAFSVQVGFGDSNPWPFLVLGNFCSVLGSTKVGNVAIGFMVLADSFEKECRLLPTVIYVVMVFGGVVFAPIPSAIGLSNTAIGAIAAGVLLAAFLYVALFFKETLPPEKRKKVRLSDLENPLVPLRFVFRNRYLAAFTLLGICFMMPFYVATTLDLYYLDDKLGSFGNTDNGILMAVMGVSAVFFLVAVLPQLTRRMNPENILLAGMLSMMANGIIYCFVAEPWQAFAFLSPTEAFTFVSLTMMTQMVSVTVPQNEQGVVNGTIAAVKELATIVAPIVGSVLFSVGKYHVDRAHPVIQLPFIFSALVSFIGVLVIVFLLKPETNKRRQESADADPLSAGNKTQESPLLSP